jgi:2-polyprenyl-3-methyl-5-hydroxy-6-metoxy-1,4-benzoquinol methylase
LIFDLPSPLARLAQKVRRVKSRKQLPSEVRLRTLMARYRVDQLVGLKPAEFEQTVRGFLGREDADEEGFVDPERQRDLATTFHWGHNHDFGGFSLQGQMGDRHIYHLAEFIDHFGALPSSLDGQRVLDIGCWTGGTSLLLCAMGAQVVAVEEVKKYADCVQYLKQAFGLERLEVRHGSLYECTADDLQNAFDHVLFAGVLYHVTDPIVALRITFNALKDGGTCLVESTGVRQRRAMISYERRRWNWFDLSPAALELMLEDVGYEDVQVGRVTPNERLYAVARRKRHVDMRRDGLSVRTLR